MVHNLSVLKERRIHPYARTCFAVAECRGWLSESAASFPRSPLSGKASYSSVPQITIYFGAVLVVGA